MTFRPISLTAAASSESRRPVMNTYAPSLTNRFAVARPMPLLPPVMRASFPSSLPISLSFESFSSELFAGDRAVLQPRRLAVVGDRDPLEDRAQGAGVFRAESAGEALLCPRPERTALCDKGPPGGRERRDPATSILLGDIEPQVAPLL